MRQLPGATLGLTTAAAVYLLSKSPESATMVVYCLIWSRTDMVILQERKVKEEADACPVEIATKYPFFFHCPAPDTRNVRPEDQAGWLTSVPTNTRSDWLISFDNPNDLWGDMMT